MRADTYKTYAIPATPYGTGSARREDMFESSGGLTIHFFSWQKIEQLAKRFDILSIDEFEEGALPRRLFRGTLRKKIS
jgi:hypothetical protein